VGREDVFGCGISALNVLTTLMRQAPFGFRNFAYQLILITTLRDTTTGI
jgi:hypothetical protein